MPARERRPDDALLVDIRAADAEARQRDVVNLGQRRFGRIRSRRDAHDGAGKGSHGTPDRAVRGARHDGIKTRDDALVLGRIDRLVRLDIGVALAVAVGVENHRRPALGLRRVAGLVEFLHVEPADDHPSAKAFPVERSNRHLGLLDPKTMKYTFVDTCFGTHHLQFDANDFLWTSGGGQVVGWLDMKKFDETGDAAKSQGWTPMILDTNGNGKRDAYVEPNQPVDPTKDKR